MKFSNFFMPTMKEPPAGARIPSHKLLVRGGFIRKKSSGLYDILPLGVRVIHKIESIIRDEMNKSGALEVILPIMHPSTLWIESGRWNAYGKEMMKFKDRHGVEYALGPTAEEMITDLVRKEVKSYRDLPLNLYQIGRKFRDEIRPRFGLMRAREFIMKDAYSFHATDEDADREYWGMYDVYSRIFERMGLKFKVVEADTGEIGGKFSHEFLVIADTGEEGLVYCKKCGYAATLEKAEAFKPLKPEAFLLPIEEVYTPNVKRIEDVSKFLNVPKTNILKLLVYMSDEKPISVAIRGDKEINEVKLKRLLKTRLLRLASDEEIKNFTGQDVGFLSPIGLSIPLYADYSVISMVNFVAGSGKANYHLMNVNYDRDFKVDEFADLSIVRGGDRCPRCGAPLTEKRGIEVGQIFKLGTRYSKAMNAYITDESGNQVPMVMGTYGIGVTRVMAAAVESNYDENGIIWPVSISPFEVEIIPTNLKDKTISELSESIYQSLSRNFDVAIDDRSIRTGIKFKDADLVGIPFQVIVGKKAKENIVELKFRKTGKRIEVNADSLGDVLSKEIGIVQ